FIDFMNFLIRANATRAQNRDWIATAGRHRSAAFGPQKRGCEWGVRMDSMPPQCRTFLQPKGRAPTPTVWTPFVLTLMLALAAGILAGCGGDNPGQSNAGAAKEKTLYTCGMHPQVIQDKPGICPICGMKLTPIRKQAAAGSATNSGQQKIKHYKSTMMPGEVS